MNSTPLPLKNHAQDASESGKKNRNKQKKTQGKILQKSIIKYNVGTP